MRAWVGRGVRRAGRPGAEAPAHDQQDHRQEDPEGNELTGLAVGRHSVDEAKRIVTVGVAEE